LIGGALGLLRGLGRYGAFVAALMRATVVHPPSWARVVHEAYQIGVRSFPILFVIAGFVGTNLALQGWFALTPLGGQRMVGMLVSLAVVREMAPIIAASMVAAKAGTEMASEIGVMRIQEQIDALEVMAVDPLAWLVSPRLLGIMLVLPALTVLSIFIMVGSAWAVCVWQLDLTGQVFLEYAVQRVRPMDFWYGELKGAVFGLVICTVSCYHGFHCGKGPEGVGRATNQAVVTSAVVCVLLNYLLSEIMYGGQS
jgi:phospholipid/cholesterol/gamma-HCH transport system permease protein